MYVIAIAWLYVALMASISDTTIVGGILTFFFYGIAPLALFMWLFGAGARKRARQARQGANIKNDNHEPDGDQ
ncbi:MAG: hypothetical protein RBS40_14445 [Rhodocyclaceae bacterium]|jgi:hypothetical protein|nr:hypothetical protein [Rhodocyclaceae bacterium]